MRIIRVFPRRTSFTPKDDYAFVGEPPLFLPDWRDIKAVHISVTFTWDMAEGKRLVGAWSNYHPEVYIGGPAFNDLGDSFLPGQYVKPGITFTSRGCNNQCPWCLVPEREGRLKEMDFWSGNIIQDNNLLQCSRRHLNRVFEMLKGEHGIQFSGGLDARLVTERIADNLRNLRVNQLFLSCDTKEAIKPLKQAIAKLTGFPYSKLRCYVLLAFGNETISQATERLEEVWQAGCMPFAQLYQPPDRYIRYSKEWRDLARIWSRPAAMKSLHKEFEKCQGN